MEIREYLDRRKALMDGALLKFLPSSSRYVKKLRDAVKYALTTGGKRIRPILVLEACKAVSGRDSKALPMAAAIEMIHTYTLVHDDLPAMDDDDYRRGKPTVHKKFDEATAILAGDLLNTLAFEIIARAYGKLSPRLILELSGSIGLNGVVGGQTADIEAEGRKLSGKELDFISRHKTADLFIASVRCGAIIGGASPRELSALTAFAGRVGLAFQIIDDILDHGQDKRKGYPALMGLEGSKKAAKREIDLAIKALPKGKRYGTIGRIALFLAGRKH